MSLSSKWLGHFPFKEETWVRVPLGLPINLRTMKSNIFVQHHNIIVHMATEILVSSD